jgi:hypothetical protein
MFRRGIIRVFFEGVGELENKATSCLELQDERLPLLSG